MKKLTAFKARGIKRHKEEFMNALSAAQLSPESGRGFIIEGETPLLAGKFVEKVLVKEDVFDLNALEYLPVKREQVLVCSFLVDLKGGWFYLDGPVSNLKTVFGYLTEYTGGAVAFEPCELSLPRVMDVLADRFGDFEVLKVRVSKIRLDKSTAFSGELLPRGWSNDQVVDLSEHWRSITVRVTEDRSEGKLTITKNAAMGLADAMWASDGRGWAGMLATLVKASRDR